MGERGEENKIVQFGTAESNSNNNTGNLSLSPLDSFVCAKIKKTTKKKDAAVKFLFCGLRFFPPLFTHIMVNFICHSSV